MFGIGLSRTGTTPLALALGILGFTAFHFLNPATGEVISEADTDLVDAATDTPVCVNFEKLYYLYPFSKFIYTTRPFEDWQPSFCRYLDRRWGTADFATIGKMLMRGNSLTPPMRGGSPIGADGEHILWVWDDERGRVAAWASLGDTAAAAAT